MASRRGAAVHQDQPLERLGRLLRREGARLGPPGDGGTPSRGCAVRRRRRRRDVRSRGPPRFSNWLACGRAGNTRPCGRQLLSQRGRSRQRQRAPGVPLASRTIASSSPPQPSAAGSDPVPQRRPPPSGASTHTIPGVQVREDLMERGKKGGAAGGLGPIQDWLAGFVPTWFPGASGFATPAASAHPQPQGF
jgi:hypothetical protein